MMSNSYILDQCPTSGSAWLCHKLQQSHGATAHLSLRSQLARQSSRQREWGYIIGTFISRIRRDLVFEISLKSVGRNPLSTRHKQRWRVRRSHRSQGNPRSRDPYYTLSVFPLTPHTIDRYKRLISIRISGNKYYFTVLEGPVHLKVIFLRPYVIEKVHFKTQKEGVPCRILFKCYLKKSSQLWQ